MTMPAPYNRDTLQGIREAARNEASLEEHAARLGWPVSQLRSVCQRNCIEMRSVPGKTKAAPAVEPAMPVQGLPPDKPPRNAARAGGLVFDSVAGRVWHGGGCIDLDSETLQILEMIARAAPRVAARDKIEKTIFDGLPPYARGKAMDWRLATLINALPRIGHQLALCDGGEHIALVKDTVAAEGGAA